MSNLNKILWVALVLIFLMCLFLIDKTEKTNLTPNKIHILKSSQGKHSNKINSYAQAVHKAEKTNKKVLLMFTARWCGPCKKMKNTTLKNENVREEMDKFVIYTVDVDKEKELASQYDITGVPSYLIIDSDESVVRRKTGACDSKEFISWLKGNVTRSRRG